MVLVVNTERSLLLWLSQTDSAGIHLLTVPVLFALSCVLWFDCISRQPWKGVYV